MKFIEQILGHHALEVWVAGLFWTFWGIALVKIFINFFV